jgi:hypothetical protein
MATAITDTTRVEGRHDAGNWSTLDSVADVMRQTRNTVADVRDATKDVAEHIELAARRRPLTALAVASAVGLLAGTALAFGVRWYADRRGRAWRKMNPGERLKAAILRQCAR